MCTLYPERLLPKIEQEVLEDHQIQMDSKLCRRVISDIYMKTEFGFLSPNAIEGVEYFRLSTNIIPPTQPSDVLIEVTSAHGGYWVKGVAIPKLSDVEYNILKQVYFLFKISDIHGFKATVPFNKKKIKAKTGEPSLEFIFKIIHKPLICNYHHYESRIFYGDEIESVKAQKIKVGDDTYRAAIAHRLHQKFEQIAEF